MKNPPNAKERGLLKGAIRRVFSRSELRKEALAKHRLEHFDPNRPRVTKWSFCGECGCVTPEYLIEVDHVEPIIRVNESLSDLSWDTLIEDRVWCSLDNLVPKCQTCHKAKSKLENAERRRIKNERRNDRY